MTNKSKNTNKPSSTVAKSTPKATKKSTNLVVESKTKATQVTPVTEAKPKAAKASPIAEAKSKAAKTVAPVKEAKPKTAKATSPTAKTKSKAAAPVVETKSKAAPVAETKTKPTKKAASTKTTEKVSKATPKTVTKEVKNTKKADTTTTAKTKKAVAPAVETKSKAAEKAPTSSTKNKPKPFQKAAAIILENTKKDINDPSVAYVEVPQTRSRKPTENYPVKYKGISRVDSPKSRTFGWYVRVFFNAERKVRFFSDGKYGGMEKSFQKALQFRNKAEKELGKPRTDRVVVTRTYNSTTGIIGLHRKREKSITKSGEIRYRNMYEITWCPEPNKMARTRVSIDKYGEEGALVKAYRIRRAKERLVYGKCLQPALINKPKYPDEEE
jgi:hypothetical protein